MTKKKEKETKEKEKKEDGEEQKKSEESGEALEKRIKELEADNKELNEKLLYRMAEFDNFRRRTAQENRRFMETANQELIKQLLPVLDSLKRAAAEENRGSDSQALFQGIELIHNQFMDIMDKNGVKPIAALGKPFDPMVHDALMQSPSDEYKEDTVMQEVETGYMLNDYTLRPSKVIVSKGKEEQPKELEDTEEAEKPEEQDNQSEN